MLTDHAEYPKSEHAKRGWRKRESAKSHDSLPSVSETMELDITEEERGLSLLGCHPSICNIYSGLLEKQLQDRGTN